MVCPGCTLVTLWMWLALWCCTMPAYAQELEPRAYSAAPVGTDFLAATYTRLSGVVLTAVSIAAAVRQ